jgi:hypothetical protein
VEQGDLCAEIKRVEQRLTDYMARSAAERETLKEQLIEYKETVRAKHLEMNEVRNQISEERGQFALRSYSDARIDACNDRLTKLESAFSGMNGRLLGLGMGLTVLMFLIEIAFKFWK